MVFEVISTQSLNVLGTFEDESVAREAVQTSVARLGAGLGDLVVFVSDDDGRHVAEYGDSELATWARIGASYGAFA